MQISADSALMLLLIGIILMMISVDCGLNNDDQSADHTDDVLISADRC
jgi:hypothetical protein